MKQAARKLERIWRQRNEPLVDELDIEKPPRRVRVRPLPRRVSMYGDETWPLRQRALIVGWTLFAIAFGLGLALGWLLWA